MEGELLYHWIVLEQTMQSAITTYQCMITWMCFWFKGAFMDKCNIIPQFFQKKVGILVPLKVLAWVMTTCWVSCSWLSYLWRNMNISSIFFFSKSTSINTQCILGVSVSPFDGSYKRTHTHKDITQQEIVCRVIRETNKCRGGEVQ